MTLGENDCSWSSKLKGGRAIPGHVELLWNSNYLQLLQLIRLQTFSIRRREEKDANFHFSGKVVF